MTSQRPNDVIQMVPVLDLALALDSSVDFGCWPDSDSYCTCCYNTQEMIDAGVKDEDGNRIPSPDEDTPSWVRLFQWKLGELDHAFVQSVRDEGIVAPIVVQVRADGTWQQGNGNHRLAVAIRDLPFDEVPVLFVRDGNYMREDVSENYDYPESH